MPLCSSEDARGVAFSRLASHLSPFWARPLCPPEWTNRWSGVQLAGSSEKNKEIEMSYPNKFRGFLCLGLLFGLYIYPAQAETLKTSVHRIEKVRRSLGSGLNDEGSKILRNSFSAALSMTSGGGGGRWNYIASSILFLQPGSVLSSSHIARLMFQKSSKSRTIHT